MNQNKKTTMCSQKDKCNYNYPDKCDMCWRMTKNLNHDDYMATTIFEENQKKRE